ncbi:hypothetical protein AAMO2058_000080500 [Amorphochlora amoebiformis]
MNFQDVKKVQRQLKIHTGACKRLTVDLKLYVEEKNELFAKLKKVEAGGDKYAIKTQRELLEETCAVIIDTHGKVKNAYQKLDRLVCSVRSKSSLCSLEEVEIALAQLKTTHTLLNSKKNQQKSEAKSSTPKGVVSVFGSSSTKPTDKYWGEAEMIGETLAQMGYTIMNGGYGGLMEAISKGASKVEGSKIRGVLVPTVFPMRKGGNKYLTERPEAKTIEDRLSILLGQAQAFIVLPGSLGSLTELVMAWNRAVLAPLSGKKPPVIIAYKNPWEKIITTIGSTLGIHKTMVEMVRFVSDGKEAIALAQKLL